MKLLEPVLKLYRARFVVPMSAPIIEDGAVVVCDGIILAVGKSADLKRDYPSVSHHDLGEVILMPGLINAHCHLDYTMMRGRLAPGSSFTTWVQELNKIKFSLREEDVVAAMMKGWEELYSWGCTSVVNIVSFPAVLEKLPSAPLRLWHLIEVMDIRGSQQGEEGLKVVEAFLKKKANKKIVFGISPHAPQTTSQGLYRAAAQLAKNRDAVISDYGEEKDNFIQIASSQERGSERLFCTHLAESEEEFEMFTKERGLLFDFLKSFGRDMSDCGFQTPVQALLQNELLPHGSLLVHMNFLNEKDHKLLASRADDFFVVHCPKTHRFFERPPFDWKFFYEHHYPLLLGTDSLASNDTLNLFSEMQAMAETAPELAPQEILKMVTLHPARAIGMASNLGELSAGAFADMITIPFGGEAKDVFGAVIHNKILPTMFC